MHVALRDAMRVLVTAFYPLSRRDTQALASETEPSDSSRHSHLCDLGGGEALEALAVFYLTASGSRETIATRAMAGQDNGRCCTWVTWVVVRRFRRSTSSAPLARQR